MGATILPIERRHVEDFWAALDSVARERRYLCFLKGPRIESTEAFVINNIANGHTQFVAMAGNRVVGWCDIIPVDRDGLRHTGILGIGIRSEHRGQGLGRRLMEAALADAFEKDLSRIELEVFASNTSAIALYEKFGFVPEGRKRKGRFLDGEWDDLIIMGLLKEEYKKDEQL